MGPRGESFGKPTGKSPDQALGTLKQQAFAFLERLQRQKDRISYESGERMPGYPAALDRLARPDAPKDPNEVFDLLFEEGVPPGVLSVISEKYPARLPDGKPFKLTESHVKERFFGPGLITAQNFETKFAGEEWLSSLIEDTLGRRKIDLDIAHHVQALARSAGGHYPGADSTVRLMFMCMDDSGGGAPQSVLDRVVRTRMEEAGHGKPERNDKPERDDFFVEMRKFLGMYADITKSVLARTKSSPAKREIERKARKTLSDFLRSSAFQAAYVGPGQRPPNLFDTFSDMLIADSAANPWLTGDGRDTPFDVGRFGDLITKDAPRGLIAESAAFLNNYQAAMLAQRLETDLGKWSESIKQKGEHPLSPATSKKLDQAFERARMLDSGTEGAPADDSSARIKVLRDFVDRNLIFSKRQESGVHPFSILMRMTDPKKIVTHENLRHDFVSLLSCISKLDESDWPTGKALTLASSVQLLSRDESPYMDIPLLGVEDNPSLWMLLEENARRWFPPAILANGPHAYSAEEEGVRFEPLIEPRDVADMSPEELEQLAKNFDTASGVDMLSKRAWISRACAVWNDMPNAYERILNFARREAEKYYGTGGMYSLAFYTRATAAINDLAGRLLPRMSDQDYIIISNQEYDAMTEAFTNHGADVAPIYFNDRKLGKARRPDAILDKIHAEIEIKRQGRVPRAIILSSKTRFGDALGVLEGQGGQNAEGLSLLIAGFKRTYPDVPVIVDGCQSVGRNDLGEILQKLGCDVYINSGAKALGIENVAMMAVKREFGEKSPERLNWLSDFDDPGVRQNPAEKLSAGKGTVDIQRVAALGIALQLMNSRFDTWRAGGEGSPLKMRERVARHMSDLTRYAIKRSEDYAMALLTHPDFPLGGPSGTEISDSAVQHQFGCRVVYPVHRKRNDYNGILTMTFPGLGERDIKERLRKSGGYRVERCIGKERRAVRVSFHYLHETKDIDALFDAIIEIHLDYLRRRVADKGIDSFAALREAVPDVKDEDWMED